MSTSAPIPVPAESAASKRRRSSRGQVLIIYVMAIFVFVGMLAVVIDISWYWISSNRIQKAADAAALAGVVWLPGDEQKAVQTAIYEAAKNGYTVASSGVPLNGVTLTAAKAADGRRLNVSINAPIGTFFMRVFGLNTIPATRASSAEYVSPVAMGSPENYYGVFGDVRNATMSTTTTSIVANTPTTDDDSTALVVSALATPASSATGWTSITAPTTSANLVANVGASDANYAYTTTNGRQQQWQNFNVTFPALTGAEVSRSILGIRVNLDGVGLSASCSKANQAANQSRVGVDLTWNNGTTWSTVQNSGNLTTTAQNSPVGSTTTTTAWGPATPHTWVTGDFTNANFRVRWTAVKGASCAAGTDIRVDRLRVQVFYRTTSQTYSTVTSTNTTAPADYPLYGPGSPCTNGVAGCYQSTGPTAINPAPGQALNARGFWATMNTRGAANLNGDAFQPIYDHDTTLAPVCPTATLRACFDPDNYYNYAVEMPPNSTGGYVYIFDPVFCATAINSGTGDRWFGTSNGVSSYYELYTTGTSLYTRADDTLIVSSGTTFQAMDLSDSQMGGSGGSECRQSNIAYGTAADYHDAWYLLNPSNPLTGGPNGTIYRVHTTGSNASTAAAQLNVSAEQSFAILATGSTLPKVYGIGAMQMFTPLEAPSSPNKVSSFYLAQIDPIHAGRTLELHLWDPGDTGNLVADLAIMVPTSTVGTWAATPFSYSAAVGTTGSSSSGQPNAACNTNKGASVTSLRSNNGGGVPGNFNGCWLTIDIPIPANYVGYQQGWWQIQYTMHNSSSGLATSSDVTTWTAEIQGNPVHLVLP